MIILNMVMKLSSIVPYDDSHLPVCLSVRACARACVCQREIDRYRARERELDSGSKSESKSDKDGRGGWLLRACVSVRVS